MAKQRALDHHFDDDFDIYRCLVRHEERLHAAILHHLDGFLAAMASTGFSEHSPLNHATTRLKRAFRRSVERAGFVERFAPIEDWLTENGLTLAGKTGRFHGRRCYRIKNAECYKGFTITFGTISDAIHFKLRWGGKAS